MGILRKPAGYDQQRLAAIKAEDDKARERVKARADDAARKAALDTAQAIETIIGTAEAALAPEHGGHQMTPDEKTAATTAAVGDSYRNFLTQTGIGAGNANSAGHYAYNPKSWERFELDNANAESWMIGVAISAIAEDMTRNGVHFTGSTPPKEIAKLEAGFQEYLVWTRIKDAISGARQYGTCALIPQIAGQLPQVPLKVESVGLDQFKGFAVLDRWMLNPDMGQVVTTLGARDQGLPLTYTNTSGAIVYPNQVIHHTRVWRFEGIKQQYYPSLQQTFWSLSIIQRLWDRLVAHDSAFNGAAQLVYKCWNRIYKVPRLREIIADGGRDGTKTMYTALIESIRMMKHFQGNEGISVIDGEDELEAITYGFGGIAEMMTMFVQQLAGASGVPVIRLLGATPGSLGATGDADLELYEANIKQRQESDLRDVIDMTCRMIARSKGIKLSDDFGFQFNPLREIKQGDRVKMACDLLTAFSAAADTGFLRKSTALKELKAASQYLDIFSNITDEEIQDAAVEERQDKLLGDLDMGGIIAGPQPDPKQHTGAPGSPQAADPAPGMTKTAVNPPIAAGNRQAIGDAALMTPNLREVIEWQGMHNLWWHGLQIRIENRKGTARRGEDPLTGPWQVESMPAHYGEFMLTGSAEGANEGLDVFVGPDPSSLKVFVIWQQWPDEPKQFDEFKVMVCCPSEDFARNLYIRAFSDRGAERIQRISEMTVVSFMAWLASGEDTPELFESNKPEVFGYIPPAADISNIQVEATS